MFSDDCITGTEGGIIIRPPTFSNDCVAQGGIVNCDCTNLLNVSGLQEDRSLMSNCFDKCCMDSK